MSKFIITITPPTPNGDLHIGHLAEPFLSADISCGQDSDASQCEECACAPNYLYMKNLKCKLCGGQHEWIEKKHAYLNISKNVRKQRTWLSDSTVRLNPQAFVERELAPTPQDWRITRHGDAGLDIGQPNLSEAHTWFMGMAGYIAANREHFTVNQQTPQLFDAFWRADNTTLVNFRGYDCLYSHGTAYPMGCRCWCTWAKS